MNRKMKLGVLALLVVAGLLLTACENKEQKAGTYNDRESADDYNKSGIAYFNKDDYDRAIADYTSALRIDPNYAKAYFNRGNAYGMKGDYDRAIADFTSALRIDPNYAKAYNSRGFAYFNKGDYDRAIADHTSAIRIDPNYASAYTSRGNAYYYKGDYDRAIADYEATLRIDPNDASAKGNLEVAKANSQPRTTTPSHSSTSRLNNTTWYKPPKTTSIPNPIGGGRYDMSGSYTSPSVTLYFGNANYRMDGATSLWSNDNDETGTFTVSGDTVTLTSTSGRTRTGSVIGSSLKIDDITYTRIE
jgi:tetratricopeptide (TPR) repeat protein